MPQGGLVPFPFGAFGLIRPARSSSRATERGLRLRSLRRLGFALAAFSVAITLQSVEPSPAHAQALPPVPVPPENPLTAEKAMLGKILFWDQQLSTDETTACGSCHAIARGGTEAAPAVHPGPDGLFATADDHTGSIGVRRRDENHALVDDPLFGFAPQVTGRAAPNFFGGLWATNLLYDGRATGEFRDPVSGAVVIPSGGGLESQSLGPILNTVEMATPDWTWADVVDRLATSTPLALATNLPTDMAQAIAAGPTYPVLFNTAFGDPAITPVRIAFAIASYERTLVSDQTDWDAFMAGDNSALSAQEQLGWAVFDSEACSVCHTPPLFTDNSFRNIGVRDPAEDNGREAITGDPADRGRFKVPTLRNVTLKASYFHTGEFPSLSQVIALYQPGSQQSLENIDPLMPVNLSIEDRIALQNFIIGGLVDDRVKNELPPFDRPDLTPVFLPEPSVWAGLGAGMALLWGIRARATRFI